MIHTLLDILATLGLMCGCVVVFGILVVLIISVIQIVIQILKK